MLFSSLLNFCDKFSNLTITEIAFRIFNHPHKIFIHLYLEEKNSIDFHSLRL